MVDKYWRIVMEARMIDMFISMVGSPFNTDESMATPCL